MKHSSYIVIIKIDDERSVIFNCMTRRFFYVSNKNKEKFWDVLTHANSKEFANCYNVFLEKMQAEKFLLDDDVDERKILDDFVLQNRFSDEYMLLVMPTYRCNLRCWYCVQNHQDVDWSNQDVARIKKHISKYLIDNKISKFRLSWFGGEPLLKYDLLIDLLAYAKSFCEKHNIQFSSDIATNSLLLTHDRIIELGKLGLKSFQITIDGNREQHNKVKQTSNDSAYDTALHNILDIVQTIEEVRCILRINYSDKSLEPGKIIHDIDVRIPSLYRPKIQILPKKIWQIEESKIQQNKVVELASIIKRKKYQLQPSNMGFCYVDQTHYNAIFPNGRIGKCDNDPLEDATGVLTDSGDIVWEKPQAFIENFSYEEGHECYDCIYFPFCGGPCPAKRNNMMKQYGTIKCQFNDKDTAMKQRILQYCSDFTD